MQVIDEITRKLVNSKGCTKVVVRQSEEDGVIFGYTKHAVGNCVNAMITYKDGRSEILPVILESMRDNLFFSNYRGLYMSRINMTQDKILQETYTKGQGAWPYSFERRYEAVENFGIFKDRSKRLVKKQRFPMAKHLKYTFGMEFETSEGYVPEDLCFQDGLIPLRDGSISGLEYSTIVLEGEEGLVLMDQGIRDLKRFTSFNKECSLHIHLGGYPLEPDKLFALYAVCYRLQPELQSMVPQYTFRSSKYKKSGKDYCNLLPAFYDFNGLYEGLVGRQFFGSLTQPHPNDIERKAKWRISTRYYWLNFINAICYTVNKTIEFRFLRPTWNVRKITLWLYIFNGILKFSEENFRYISRDLNRRLTLETVLKKAYPKSVADKLIPEIAKLKILVKNQKNNGDDIGQDISLEDDLFPSGIAY